MHSSLDDCFKLQNIIIECLQERIGFLKNCRKAEMGNLESQLFQGEKPWVYKKNWITTLTTSSLFLWEGMRGGGGIQHCVGI